MAHGENQPAVATGAEPNPVLRTIHEAALQLRMSDSTLRNRIHDGALRAFRDGKVVRVYQQDLDRYIEDHKSGGKP